MRQGRFWGGHRRRRGSLGGAARRHSFHESPPRPRRRQRAWFASWMRRYEGFSGYRARSHSVQVRTGIIAPLLARIDPGRAIMSIGNKGKAMAVLCGGMLLVAACTTLDPYTREERPARAT